MQQVERERGLVSRASSTSKRAIMSSSRPSSSAEFAENRSNRLGSGGRLSAAQRVQPGFESKSSSFTRTATSRGGRDDALKSFELLTIGAGKRK